MSFGFRLGEAFVISQGCQPLAIVNNHLEAPKGAIGGIVVRSIFRPCQGFRRRSRRHPRLTPWANACRRSRG